MKKFFLLFLSVLLCVSAIAQTNCHCPKNRYTDTKADTVFRLTNGKKIALCGYSHKNTNPPSYSEFVLSVCSQDTMLGFWGAMYSYPIEVDKDTLLIKQIDYLPVGKNFKRENINWSTEKLSFIGDKVGRSRRVNRSFPHYDSLQIQQVLKHYSQAHKTSEKGYDQLMGELFVAAISGSKKARQELFTMKDLDIGAAGGEYQDRLIEMLYFWEAQHNTSLPDSIVKDIQKIHQFVMYYQVDSLANNIEYPLHRAYPIPSITDKKTFVKRYDSLFDKFFQQLILEAPLSDWSTVGWRGIMLGNGQVWLDYNGKIKAINYESQAEKRQQETLIAQDRAHLYKPLQNYKKPVLKLNTKKYHIRIDRLNNGTFRYVSWRRGSDESQPPNLVLNNGHVKYDGSGGNHRFLFTKGEYTYVVNRLIIRAKYSPEARLVVKKKNEIILREKCDVLDQ